MLEYIYFVKCPGCDDEHFDFFSDAKEFAMSCLNSRPVITQIEINRNDFGECVDSCDLGTVWSWEDVMQDISADADFTVFNKADTSDCDCNGSCGGKCSCGKHKHDSEFDMLDNSLDFIPDSFKKSAELEEAYYAVIEVDGKERRIPFKTKEEARDYINYVFAGKEPIFRGRKLGRMYTESCNKKPVPADMSIRDLVEAMEENEDMVECAGCEELFPKDECFYDEERGWLCGDCEDSVVKCTWCEELYDKYDCKYEVDMGWLCDHCQAAIRSRGEELTFKETSYWDFLDESADTKTVTWKCYFDGKEIGTVEADTEQEAYNKMERTWPELQYGLYDGVAVVEPLESINEAIDPHDLVELEYPSLTITLYGDKRSEDDWDEFEYTDSHVFLVPKVEVATAIWENWITESDVADVAGGLDALEDDSTWDKFLETHFDNLFEKYNKQILEYFKDEAIEDFRERAQEDHALNQWATKEDKAFDAWRDEEYFEESKKKSKSFLEELEDNDGYRKRLTGCPECGKNQSFDHETGICINCGFNI